MPFFSLLPADCALCGIAHSGGLLCAACELDLPYFPPDHCPICALPTLNQAVCGRCLTHPPAFDRVIPAFIYGFPLDRLLQAFKYRNQLVLGHWLAKALLRAQTSRPSPDLLLMMPLHPNRLKARGFNQAMELAKNVRRNMSLPLLVAGYARQIDTQAQASLPWQARQRNVQHAFSCEVDLSGKHVAVIDDVLTTGASLQAFAKVLKKAGAVSVEGWVVARTIPGRHY